MGRAAADSGYPGGGWTGGAMGIAELRVIFRVSDYEASVHFYERLLGLERVRAWDGAEGAGIILRAGAGRTIELFGPPRGGRHDERLARGVELGVEIDDAVAWYDRLRAAGLPIARGVVDNPWGDRSFGIDDPDGVRIWLFEVTA